MTQKKSARDIGQFSGVDNSRVEKKHHESSPGFRKTDLHSEALLASQDSCGSGDCYPWVVESPGPSSCSCGFTKSAHVEPGQPCKRLKYVWILCSWGCALIMLSTKSFHDLPAQHQVPVKSSFSDPAARLQCVVVRHHRHHCVRDSPGQHHSCKVAVRDHNQSIRMRVDRAILGNFAAGRCQSDPWYCDPDAVTLHRSFEKQTSRPVSAIPMSHRWRSMFRVTGSILPMLTVVWVRSEEPNGARKTFLDRCR